jgi:hypothetical protein
MQVQSWDEHAAAPAGPRSDVTKYELHIIMRTLITGSADDVQHLRELDILNDLPDDESGIGP